MSENGVNAYMPVAPAMGGYGDGMMGGGWSWWIIILLIFGGWGNGFGWGGNNFANAIGYNNLATQNDVQRGFDTMSLQDQSRDILSAVTAASAQAVAATNQAKYDNINVAKDAQSAITAHLSAIEVGQANMLANQNECCCNTLRAIDNLNYQGALNTAAIQQSIAASDANTVAVGQKILDAITGNRMADMQNQINALQLRDAMAGVVRYPTSTVYSSGNNPFCACC